MLFESFVEIYLNDLRLRIKYNTYLTKVHIIEAINTLEVAVKNVTNTQNGSISNTNTSLSSFISTFNSWRSSWTSTRAGKIDTIESRLTDARAKKLDNLDYSISNLKSGLQNKVDEAKLVIEDLGDRLTTKKLKILIT